jgi:DNA replicative helicase MCM subunit Mcm2 (Cdc46/Mcm family)
MAEISIAELRSELLKNIAEQQVENEAKLASLDSINLAMVTAKAKEIEADTAAKDALLARLLGGVPA